MAHDSTKRINLQDKNELFQVSRHIKSSTKLSVHVWPQKEWSDCGGQAPMERHHEKKRPVYKLVRWRLGVTESFWLLRTDDKKKKLKDTFLAHK